MICFQQSDNVLVFSHEVLARECCPLRSAEFHAFSSCFGQPRIDSLPQCLGFVASHFGEQREHNTGGRVAFPVRQERFDPLSMPVKRDPTFLKRLHKVMSNAIPSSKS